MRIFAALLVLVLLEIGQARLFPPLITWGLVLTRGPAENPLFQAFFEAGEQAGHPNTTDVNGYRQEGFAPFDANRHRGRRLSAARAYLHPVLKRPNLELVTRAHTALMEALIAGKTEGEAAAAGGSILLTGGGAWHRIAISHCRPSTASRPPSAACAQP